MFLQNSDGSFSLVRGDTGYLQYTVKDINGEIVDNEYIQSVLFTCRKKIKTPILFQVEGTSNIIKILPECTKDLKFGTYVFDVQTIFKNGDVHSSGVCTLQLEEEVTY